MEIYIDQLVYREDHTEIPVLRLFNSMIRIVIPQLLSHPSNPTANGQGVH